MFPFRSLPTTKPNIFGLTGRNKQIWDLFKEIRSILTLFFDLLISLPISILDKFGIQLIPNLFFANLPLCSICICGAIFGVTSSVGIGLGVGLGVGLNCKEILNISKINNQTIHLNG